VSSKEGDIRRAHGALRAGLGTLVGLGVASSEACAAGKKLKEAEVRKIEAAP